MVFISVFSIIQQNKPSVNRFRRGCITCMGLNYALTRKTEYLKRAACKGRRLVLPQ